MEVATVNHNPQQKVSINFDRIVKACDRNMAWLAVGFSIFFHFSTIAFMHLKDQWNENLVPPKPQVAKVRILANPNGNPAIQTTKAVEIAKPKIKPKKNTRAIAKQQPEVETPPEETNSAPQSFGDDLTGGVVGTGISTTDGSSDPGVTANAEPIERVKPEFPQEAALKGIEGWVILRFDINEQGGVENVQVVDASPRGLFEKKAREAVRRWKYAPRMSSGEAVRVIGREVQIDFKFDS